MRGMERKAIKTEQAPAAIGPYSQAIAAGGMVYCSGQIPLDPATGEMVGAGDVVREAEQVMKNLGAVLEAAGSGFEKVVKATIFLVDLGDFAAVNEVYAKAFTIGAPPARACVEVSKLPKGSKVEIECIALQ